MTTRLIVLAGTIALLATGCGDPTGPDAPLLFTSLSAGDAHTCGLAASGKAYCWGWSAAGELGVPDSLVGACLEGWGDIRNACASSPTAVSGGLRFQSVTAGNGLTCGVTRDGVAYCWGWNPYGQLGVGPGIDTTFAPLPVAGGLRFSVVRAGLGLHTCGLTTDGAAYCWGDNRWGQLGTGSLSYPSSPSPLPVAGDRRYAQIGDGSAACAIDVAAALYCWGWNVGPEPLHLFGSDVGWVSVGAGTTCVLDVDHAAYCEGDSNYGQLGNPTNDGSQFQPVTGGLAFSSISVGGNHVCGLTTDGRAYCWGSNASGELGNRDAGSFTFVPTPVSGGLRFKSITAGYSHTCALGPTGAAYCWGENLVGQLGDGEVSVEARYEPTPVVGPDEAR